MFDETDVERAAPACVLGQTVATCCSANRIRSGKRSASPVSRAASSACWRRRGSPRPARTRTTRFCMPYTTVMKKIKGQPWLDDIMMSAVVTRRWSRPPKRSSPSCCASRHHIREGAPDDFNLRHPTEIAETLAASARTMEVTSGERRVGLAAGRRSRDHEHHAGVRDGTHTGDRLRLAMGARHRDVLRQFLCEAIVLSLDRRTGRRLGLGVSASHAISDVFGWATRVSANADRAVGAVLARDRHFLWLLPRDPGRRAGSDRSAPIRMMSDAA